MTNTNKDFSILEKIAFLKQLKNEDKEVLLDLINSKDIKIQTATNNNK